MTNRSRISLIMGLIGLERPSLFAFELGKNQNETVDTVASTNSNQSAPNLVKMYVTNRSLMSLIMVQIGQDRSELSALELEKLLYLTLFILYYLQI